MAPLSSPHIIFLETSVHVGTYITVCVRRPEDSLQESVLSFHRVDSTDWASVFRFAVRCICLYHWSHLTISKVNLSVEYSFLGTEIHYLPPKCQSHVPSYTTFRDGPQHNTCARPVLYQWTTFVAINTWVVCCRYEHHVCAWCCGDQKRVSGLLELKL